MTNKTEWEGRDCEVVCVHEDGEEFVVAECLGDYETGGDDFAALIVHCLNNFPALEAERDALREALKLALEYWAHRQQRYKNRHPRWVADARKALAISEKSE